MAGKQKARVFRAKTERHLEEALEEFLNRDAVTNPSIAFSVNGNLGYERFFALITYTYNDGIKRG